MVDETIPAPPKKGIYKPDSLILYGVKLNSVTNHAMFDVGMGGNTALRVQLFTGNQELAKAKYSIVLAYGYAYEGHCYRFDATRVFIVTTSSDDPAVGCGFDPQPEMPPSLNPYRDLAYPDRLTDLLEVAAASATPRL